ncbi:hypothetical protein [Methylobacterium radiotolerans]|uniref:Uncharacterized protein n=1 Tax=Methylobacterium radiotolerans (strain ATCC 27329 / DSM 1819 / JCM 2831 / NBRC 15690 / NCIMB 10815 / 0-1) TaxID=426355 RepID=B1M9Q5_METRJ|nr:hypothetical protein [Methylobacterium radiotolerans]ACB28230.1 hypothetical protein Mrad2831_6308 [Methylobacterium radiotolerans JCM 2831]GEN01767.1 hypothetical protein MRA01_63060 [Methylobacterium radiotolerans]
MKWILLFGALFLFSIALMDMADAPVRAEQVVTQRRLAEGQRALLVQLQRVGTPDASRLAAEWNEAYPQPDDATVANLLLVVERVKADPSTAASFTVEGKRKDRRELEDKFTPVFGWSDDDPKPGL